MQNKDEGRETLVSQTAQMDLPQMRRRADGTGQAQKVKPAPGFNRRGD